MLPLSTTVYPLITTNILTNTKVNVRHTRKVMWGEICLSVEIRWTFNTLRSTCYTGLKKGQGEICLSDEATNNSIHTYDHCVILQNTVNGRITIFKCRSRKYQNLQRAPFLNKKCQKCRKSNINWSSFFGTRLGLKIKNRFKFTNIQWRSTATNKNPT